MAKISKFRRSWSILALFSGFILEFAWLKLSKKVKGEQRIEIPKELYKKQAIRFRKTALSLEGMLIKVGQFFSTRVDVLPIEYTQELAQLQDEVPSVPFEGIQQVIEAELKGKLEEVFLEVDPTPLAAASIGQVHRGKLPSGEEVAIKVLRPGVERIMEIDLQAFRGVILLFKIFTDWNKTIDLDALYSEFAATVREELDYNKELANLERFKKNFAEESKISVPRVYSQFSGAKVITMEFVSGYKITDFPALEKAGINQGELAQTLINAYMKQVLVDGFYHADPHPGNMFIRPDGGITFIDFGMVGRIAPGHVRAIRKLVKGVISTDAGLMVDGLVDMGIIRPHANVVVLRKAVSTLVEKLKETNFDEIGHFQMEVMLSELREFIYSEPIQIPSNYTFLGRAAGTLSGLASGLDPSLNILEVIKPYAQYLLGEGQDSILGIAWAKAKEVGGSLVNLPGLLEKTLKQTQNGDIWVKTELGPLVRSVRFQAVLVNRLIWAMMLGFSAVIWTMFRIQGFALEARYTIYAGTVFALLFLLNIRKRVEKPLRMHNHGRK
jgi:predicted unusual protein kinase regulating ubiquinone biosynthesis (AarF/ABC1/UbiB family)